MNNWLEQFERSQIKYPKPESLGDFLGRVGQFMTYPSDMQFDFAISGCRCASSIFSLTKGENSKPRFRFYANFHGKTGVYQIRKESLTEEKDIVQEIYLDCESDGGFNPQLLTQYRLGISRQNEGSYRYITFTFDSDHRVSSVTSGGYPRVRGGSFTVAELLARAKEGDELFEFCSSGFTQMTGEDLLQVIQNEVNGEAVTRAMLDLSDYDRIASAWR